MRVLVIHPQPLVQDGLRVLIRAIAPEAEVLAVDDLSCTTLDACGLFSTPNDDGPVQLAVTQVG